jgi:hypothetical protein
MTNPLCNPQSPIPNAQSTIPKGRFTESHHLITSRRMLHSLRRPQQRRNQRPTSRVGAKPTDETIDHTAVIRANGRTIDESSVEQFDPRVRLEHASLRQWRFLVAFPHASGGRWYCRSCSRQIRRARRPCHLDSFAPTWWISQPGSSSLLHGRRPDGAIQELHACR